MERPPPLHVSEGVDGTILCIEVVEGLQRRKLDVSLSSSPAPSLYNWGPLKSGTFSFSLLYQ